MILTIDIGNTRTKWGVFDAAGNLREHEALFNTEHMVAPKIWGSCQRAILANVAEHAQLNKVIDVLNGIHLPFKLAQSTAKACGVDNSYSMAAQLGVDRWAALIGAWRQLSTTCVVISAGTAMTIDVLLVSDNHAVFKGGYILPGLSLMQNSLLSGTANLADKSKFSVNATQSSVPDNTLDAIQQGALLAAAGALKLVLDRLRDEGHQAPKCVISGGNASQLAEALRNYAGMVNNVLIFENLVLHGLFELERESE